jgi:cyclopropane-fatty-acyl-phospholipid synthase
VEDFKKFEKIFIRIVENHTKQFPKNSFVIYFDNKKKEIGKSKKRIIVKIKNAEKTIKEIFTGGSLKLGEAYCNRLIEVDDKDYKKFITIFTILAFNKKILLKLPFFDILRILKAKIKTITVSNKDQKKNINSHYSLSQWFEDEEDSNAFFLYWLNENKKNIQYSCGEWNKNTKTLKESQINKFEFYAKRLGINKNSKGKTLLDLGCGWGGLMFYYAEKFGIKCKGITLSTAQAKYIKEEIKKRKLEKLVSVEIKNVHKITGKYDYITSIAMLEAISDFEDLYCKIKSCIKEKGSILLHAMYHSDLIYIEDVFLEKYIFPGGATPNFKKSFKLYKKYFSFVDVKKFSQDSYPKTIDCWFKEFCKNQKKIETLLKKKSKCKDVDFSIRVFKHYLTLVGSALHFSQTRVCNFLLKK